MAIADAPEVQPATAEAEQISSENTATLLAEALYSLADMVNQFAYPTRFHRGDAVCDGGLSALEYAFGVLQDAGCKINSNGSIQRKNLFDFMKRYENQRNSW